ncbi:tRNA pseudouridine(55) synthase TruB [Trueperella sp. LYQ141]|uniref:tRNA pseudouridine(55) synthase TruB n=1 Tax=Trueperella sp. LYQ141 TaxID=3391058 RepID=UPI00398309E0
MGRKQDAEHGERSSSSAKPRRVMPWGDLPRGYPTDPGLLLVAKDSGVTSHDVVGAVRRLAATRQVGHSGTLDPMATGLLVVAIGRATKLIQYLGQVDKSYRARICCGVSSSTEDADGVLYPDENPVLTEPDVYDDERLSLAIDAVIGELTGNIMQVPSAVSAIKVAGRRAHELVRSGHEVVLAPRPVCIQSFTRCSPIERSTLVVQGRRVPVVEFEVDVTCSAGTYIRALARDLGQRLGVGAHLRSLHRWRIGPWDVEEAFSISQLALMTENLPVIPLEQICRDVFPAIAVNEDEARRLSAGMFIDRREPTGHALRTGQWPAVAWCDCDPVALVSPRAGQLKPDLQLMQTRKGI